MKKVATRFSDYQGVRMPSEFRGGAESGPVKTYRLSEAERAELTARLGPPQKGRPLRMTGYGATSPPAKGKLREQILALATRGLDAVQIARAAGTSERVVLTTLVAAGVEKMGKPLSEEREARIRELAIEGDSMATVAKKLGMGWDTVRKYWPGSRVIEEKAEAPAPTPVTILVAAPTTDDADSDLSRRLAAFGERVLMTSRLAGDAEKTFGGDARVIVRTMLGLLDADWQQLKGA